MPRKSLLLTIFAVLLVAGTGTAWAIYSWVVERATTVATAPNLDPIVTVASDVTGLYPGAVVPFKLEVKNPNTYPIRITSLEGFNPKTSDGCSDYAIAFVKKSAAELRALVIPAGQNKDLRVMLEMKDWAPKVCADQKLPLKVVVRAEQATG